MGGFFYVHCQFKVKEVEKIKKIYPKAKVIAHPECPPEIIKLADYVGSTSQMIKIAKKEKAKEFIILTEAGMLERLKREIPEKKFYTTFPPKICLEQKEIKLKNVYESLLKEKFKVEIEKEIREKAKRTLQKMLKI